MWRWLTWWRPPHLYRTVIVNLVAEPDVALRGVWWRQRGSWLALRKATALRSGTEPSALDGEVLIHRAQVLFVQVLNPDDRE